MLEMIGRIMIVNTTIAVKIPVPVDEGVPNNGMKPNAEWRAGSTWSRSTGPSTKIPQSPITTLGIAASVSTSAVTGPADRARGQLGEEEGDPHGERRREEERAKRGHGGAEEQVSGTHGVVQRVPATCVTKPSPNVEVEDCAPWTTL